MRIKKNDIKALKTSSNTALTIFTGNLYHGCLTGF